MNKKNLEKIVADLDDLKNLIEFFSTQEKIPPIEIDIVKRKIQDIYLLFSNQSETSSIEKTTFSPPIKAEKDIEIEESKPAPSQNLELEREIEQPKEQIHYVEDNNAIIEQKHESEKTESNSTSTKGTLSDKLKGNNVSLNERLSNIKGSDISSRLQKGPIKDLNEAIGLNDKFSYIRTLFGGDANKFRETIEQLNSAQDLSQVEKYISKNFNWNMEDPITLQFLELVHRKLQQ